MTARPLVFLDTETTGLGPHRQPWEFAAVRREVDGTEREVQFFLRIDASRAEPGALNIGGYYERHPTGVAMSMSPPSGTPTPLTVRPVTVEPRNLWNVDYAAREVAKLTAGATIVGANPAFDAEVLASLLRSQKLEPRWHYRLRDVESMTTGLFGEEVGGLARCAARLGITTDPALEHTAMGDVRTTVLVHDTVIAAARLLKPVDG